MGFLRMEVVFLLEIAFEFDVDAVVRGGVIFVGGLGVLLIVLVHGDQVTESLFRVWSLA